MNSPPMSINWTVVHLRPPDVANAKGALPKLRTRACGRRAQIKGGPPPLVVPFPAMAERGAPDAAVAALAMGRDGTAAEARVLGMAVQRAHLDARARTI